MFWKYGEKKDHLTTELVIFLNVFPKIAFQPNKNFYVFTSEFSKIARTPSFPRCTSQHRTLSASGHKTMTYQL